MTRLGQDPAFPEVVLDDYSGKPIAQEHGISKRFYAACAAMQGLVASNGYALYDANVIAEHAYKLADEILKQESK